MRAENAIALLAGLCPGPAVTVAAVRPSFLAFGAALLVGVLLGEVLRTRRSGVAAPTGASAR